MADLTGTFRTPSGNFTVTITDAGAAATMKIIDIGEITYEYDITPDQTDISKIVALYAAVNIKIYLYDQSGNDLYDRLTNTTQNPVLLTASFFDGSTGYYRFQHRPQDVTIDELSKTVTVKCQPWRLTTTMRDFFTNANYAADLMTFRHNATNGTGFTYQCVSAGRFIKRILGELSPGTVQFQSSDPPTLAPVTPNVFTDFGPDSLTNVNGNIGFVLVNVNGIVSTADGPINIANVNAIDILASLAVTDGAIVGTGVNPFYRPRILNTSSVTVNYQRLLDLGYEQTFESVQFIFNGVSGPKVNTAATNLNIPNLPTQNVNITYNESALKAVRFDLQPAYPFLSLGEISNTSIYNVSTLPVSSTNAELTSLYLVGAGAEAYAASLAYSDGKIVSGRVRGVTQIKPYDVIQFGSDAPARYQGINFRPTYLSYNFKSDEVKFKAYSID